MKLYIKQRIFTFVDSFDVYNEHGHPVYTVKDKLFAFLHHLTVYNGFEQEVGKVDQRFTFIFPAFDVSVKGVPMGSVTSEFTFFAPQYRVNYMDWTCDGDYLAHNYEVRCGYRTVATIHKKYFSLGDTYEINIEDPKDELMVLMLVLAIDAATCSRHE